MSDAPWTCANHPQRQTTLRCNRCEKPICSQCAVLTPVGYRCRECVRGQQAVFETARRTDYPVAAVLSAVGVGAAAYLLNYLAFWGLLVAPVVGGGIAEVIRWAVRRRRSRHLPLAAAVGGVVGLLPMALISLSFIPLVRGGAAQAFASVAISMIWPLANGGLMLGTLYYRLRGIRL
jgi:hypothetical protein